MSTASRTGALYLVASLDPEPAHFTVVTQAMVVGAQETAVRVLTPIGGSGGPQIAVRVGRIMVLVSDRQALESFVGAWHQAMTLADKAFGPDLPLPRVGESISAD
jgi:hypothetical protein